MKHEIQAHMQYLLKTAEIITHRLLISEFEPSFAFNIWQWKKILSKIGVYVIWMKADIGGFS